MALSAARHCRPTFTVIYPAPWHLTLSPAPLPGKPSSGRCTPGSMRSAPPTRYCTAQHTHYSMTQLDHRGAHNTALHTDRNSLCDCWGRGTGLVTNSRAQRTQLAQRNVAQQSTTILSGWWLHQFIRSEPWKQQDASHGPLGASLEPAAHICNINCS